MGREQLMNGQDNEQVLSPRRNSGRRSRVGSLKEEKLIQVAAEMFHERGYDATSLQDIADKLGLLKGSLYHYIGSKDDLLWAIIHKQQRFAMELVQRCAALDCGAEDRLANFVLGYAESLRRDRALVSVYLRDGNRLSAERRAAVLAEGDKYVRFVTDLLRDGMRHKVFRADIDPELVGLGIVGMLNSTYRWYRSDDQVDADVIISELLRLICSGVVAS
jgi:TetR/AcrR family transcriptional regulator, cholesterol catabolism regulator